MGGLHPMAYVHNPMGWVDPFGLAKKCTGDWQPADINNPKNWNGCEKCAENIQNEIGGDIVRIQPMPAPPILGGYRGANPGWAHHEVVVKDGMVFDSFTGSKGLPISEYKDLWQYPDAINFGF